MMFCQAWDHPHAPRWQLVETARRIRPAALLLDSYQAVIQQAVGRLGC
jgi:hypothetical protein